MGVSVAVRRLSRFDWAIVYTASPAEPPPHPGTSCACLPAGSIPCWKFSARQPPVERPWRASARLVPISGLKFFIFGGPRKPEPDVFVAHHVAVLHRLVQHATDTRPLQRVPRGTFTMVSLKLACRGAAALPFWPNTLMAPSSRMAPHSSGMAFPITRVCSSCKMMSCHTIHICEDHYLKS